MNGNLTRAQARAELSRRGYSPELVAIALDGADLAGDGIFPLHRHQVTADKAGGYLIVPIPWPEGGPRPADIGRAGSDAYDLTRIRRTIETVDTWLDGAVAAEYGEQPLAQDWARVAKTAEEIGEAQEEMDALALAVTQARVAALNVPAGRAVAALIAITGQNPRKGVHGTREALVSELADVACTALFAIQHFTKNGEKTWLVFLESLDKAMSRVPPEPPFPPESGMSRQDAIDNGIIG